jgi:hypothetical protein
MKTLIDEIVDDLSGYKIYGEVIKVDFVERVLMAYKKREKDHFRNFYVQGVIEGQSNNRVTSETFENYYKLTYNEDEN